MEIPSRRKLLLGLGASLLAAPTIVRAASIMDVKPIAAMSVAEAEWQLIEAYQWIKYRVFIESGDRGLKWEIVR